MVRDVSEVIIELAVFDDDDLEPTVVITDITLTIEAGVVSMPLDWSLRDLIAELRIAAAQVYGQPFPPHAEFWRAHPRPQS